MSTQLIQLTQRTAAYASVVLVRTHWCMFCLCYVSPSNWFSCKVHTACSYNIVTRDQDVEKWILNFPLRHSAISITKRLRVYRLYLGHRKNNLKFRLDRLRTGQPKLVSFVLLGACLYQIPQQIIILLLRYFSQNHTSTSQWCHRLSQRITKAGREHHLSTMDICPEFHPNPSNS